jgi:hypothetical protein
MAGTPNMTYRYSTKLFFAQFLPWRDRGTGPFSKVSPYYKILSILARAAIFDLRSEREFLTDFAVTRNLSTPRSFLPYSRIIPKRMSLVFSQSGREKNMHNFRRTRKVQFFFEKMSKSKSVRVKKFFLKFFRRDFRIQN